MVMLQEGLDLRYFCLPPKLCANVAQSVEQRFRKARVVSSILTVGSKIRLSTLIHPLLDTYGVTSWSYPDVPCQHRLVTQFWRDAADRDNQGAPVVGGGELPINR